MVALAARSPKLQVKPSLGWAPGPHRVHTGHLTCTWFLPGHHHTSALWLCPASPALAQLRCPGAETCLAEPRPQPLTPSLAPDDCLSPTQRDREAGSPDSRDREEAGQ